MSIRELAATAVLPRAGRWTRTRAVHRNPATKDGVARQHRAPRAGHHPRRSGAPGDLGRTRRRAPAARHRRVHPRFQLSAIRQSDRIGGLARSITRLAIPSVLFIAILVVATGGYSVANIFLVNHYFGPMD